MKVETNFRQQGIGKMIMTELENFAKERNINTVKLHVFHENAIACHLYEKMNYQIEKKGKKSQVMFKKVG